MATIIDLFTNAFQQTLLSLTHNWPYLLIGMLVAAGMRTFVNADAVSAWLTRLRGLGVLAATTAAVATPLCSCGTTAVILGMLANTMPWAPVIAFMVASPLTSPQELVLSAGLFGWPFALIFFASSILLGLLAGLIASLLEQRGWLDNQARMHPAPNPVALTVEPECACTAQYSLDIPLVNALAVDGENACACESLSQPKPASTGVALNSFFTELIASGKQLIPLFAGFAFLGYLINGAIPQGWISTLFGNGNLYSIPLAATFGLPFYINTEASMPMIRAFMDQGMSQGAALAFLIAGSGTSLGAIAGALTIARWRVVALVIGILWSGAIIAGYACDLLFIWF